MNQKTTLIYCLLFPLLLFSQTNFLPDSIQQKTPLQQISFLLKKAKKQTPDTLILYLQKAQTIALNEKTDTIRGEIFFKMGRYYYTIDSFESSKNYLKKAEYLLKNNRSKTYLTTLIGLGVVYNKLHNKDSTFYYKEKSLQQSILMQDTLSIADAYNNLAFEYYYSNEKSALQKAHKYYKKALHFYTKLGIEEARFYINYATSTPNKNEAKEYFNKAKKLLKNNHKGLIRLHIAKGNYYYDNKIFNNSFNSFKKANTLILKYAPKNQNLLSSFLGMGGTKTLLKEYNEALTYLSIPLQRYNELSSFNKINLLNDLTICYKATGNYKKALKFYTKKTILKDSLATLDNQKKLTEFDIKYKSAEKDSKIALQQLKITQQKKQQTYWIIGGLIILIGIIIIFQHLNNKHKRKKLLAESELKKNREISQVRTELLGNISHEIRTPLTLISGNIQMALEEENISKRITSFLNIALTNSKKVIDDANEILDLLKFEKHKIKVHTSTFSLHNFCKRVVLSFDSLAKIKNLQLNFFSSISPDMYIESDKKKIEKIINNLVSNAIKYSNANQKIDVFLSQEKNTFLLKVQDFGLGIPYKEKSKVFERFYQAENSKNIGGIGIGLALSKEFASLLQGNLTVESSLGKGSTFSLHLPLHTVEAPVKTLVPAIETSPQTSESKTAQKPHILIVEDNIEMNNFLVEILQKKYHCTTAFNGEEAIEKLKTTHFDLITSDIMMPKVDGFALREQLNELKKDIPFVFISAKNLEEDKLRGFDLGINDYITKPFSTKELVARINNLITNKNNRAFWALKNQDTTEIATSFDIKFIEKAEKIVLKHLSNEEFKVPELATELGYSQRHLSRVIKQFTGMSPVKFILEIRLQKAYHLLQQKVYPTLTEVKYEIGISSTTYFNKKFKERFGILPKEVT